MLAPLPPKTVAKYQMTASAHVDSFARDHLPPSAEWPDLLFDLPELNYPERCNATVELLDRWLEAGRGARPCLISAVESLTYRQLAERVNRIANVLTRDLGMVPTATPPALITAR